MLFRVDPSSHTPIYRQIVDQVRAALAAGRLMPGDRLPGVRELAQELAINLQTIAKAYAELAHEGVVETRRGLGTFVAGAAKRAAQKQGRDELRLKVRRLCADSLALGWTREELLECLETSWQSEVKSWKA